MNRIACLFSFFSLLLFSQLAFAADEKEAHDRVERMVHKMRGHVNVSDYQMTVTRPSWTRSMKMRVWDDRTHKRVFVRILEPTKDQGTSFLRIDYNLWNYLPSVEKVMKIPPSMMLQPWMGSDFTNDDLVKESSYIDDYDHQTAARETRDGLGQIALSVIKIEMTPHPHAPVVWGKVIFWIREKDDLPVEQQFLDERGRLIKKLLFSDFKTQDGVLLPAHWEMNSILKEGQKTTLDLLSVDFDPVPPIAASVFTERNLRP